MGLKLNHQLETKGKRPNFFQPGPSSLQVSPRPSNFPSLSSSLWVCLGQVALVESSPWMQNLLKYTVCLRLWICSCNTNNIYICIVFKCYYISSCYICIYVLYLYRHLCLYWDLFHHVHIIYILYISNSNSDISISLSISVNPYPYFYLDLSLYTDFIIMNPKKYHTMSNSPTATLTQGCSRCTPNASASQCLRTHWVQVSRSCYGKKGGVGVFFVRLL